MDINEKLTKKRKIDFQMNDNGVFGIGNNVEDTNTTNSRVENNSIDNENTGNNFFIEGRDNIDFSVESKTPKSTISAGRAAQSDDLSALDKYLRSMKNKKKKIENEEISSANLSFNSIDAVNYSQQSEEDTYGIPKDKQCDEEIHHLSEKSKKQSILKNQLNVNTFVSGKDYNLVDDVASTKTATRDNNYLWDVFTTLISLVATSDLENKEAYEMYSEICSSSGKQRKTFKCIPSNLRFQFFAGERYRAPIIDIYKRDISNKNLPQVLRRQNISLEQLKISQQKELKHDLTLLLSIFRRSSENFGRKKKEKFHNFASRLGRITGKGPIFENYRTDLIQNFLNVTNTTLEKDEKP